MRLRFLFVLLSLLAVAASQAEDLASVRILVSDTFGNRISGVDIKLTREGKITTVRDDTAVPLSHGEYSLSIRAPGFGLTDYSIKVDQSHQVIVVALKLGAMEGPKPVCSLSGKVIAGQSVSRLRFMAAYGTYVVDVDVSETGFYSFRNVECGDYVVMAVGAKDCIGARHLRVAGGDSLADLRFDAPTGPNGCPLPK